MELCDVLQFSQPQEMRDSQGHSGTVSRRQQTPPAISRKAFEAICMDATTELL